MLDAKMLTILQSLTADRCPSIREIGALLGMSFPAAQSRVEKLIAGGYVSRKAGKARSLTLTDTGRGALEVKAA